MQTYAEYRPTALGNMITLEAALEAGFTTDEWDSYRMGHYKFQPSPVCTAQWDDLAWMAHIYGPRNPRKIEGGR